MKASPARLARPEPPRRPATDFPASPRIAAQFAQHVPMSVVTSDRTTTLDRRAHRGMVTAARIYNFAIALIGTLSLTVSLIVSTTNPVGGGALNGIIITLELLHGLVEHHRAHRQLDARRRPHADGLLFRWLRRRRW